MPPRYIGYETISIDLSNYRIFNKNIPIQLGPTEFKILQLFISNKDHIFSREQIINYVWGLNNNIADRTVDVHINRLRSAVKLEHDRQIIKTVRSLGYCLNKI